MKLNEMIAWLEQGGKTEQCNEVIGHYKTKIIQNLRTIVIRIAWQLCVCLVLALQSKVDQPITFYMKKLSSIQELSANQLS